MLYRQALPRGAVVVYGSSRAVVWSDTAGVASLLPIRPMRKARHRSDVAVGDKLIVRAGCPFQASSVRLMAVEMLSPSVITLVSAAYAREALARRTEARWAGIEAAA